MASSKAIFLTLSLFLCFVVGCSAPDKFSLASDPQPLPKTQPEFFYLADQFGSQIFGLRIDDDGRLSPMPGSPFLTDAPVHLMAGLGGRFLYREDLPEDFREFTAVPSIAWFQLNPLDGSVQGGGTFQHSPGRCLGFCAVMGPDGRQLYVLESSSNFENPTINIYEIDAADGSLTRTESLPAQSDGSHLALHASGKFLFEVHPSNPRGVNVTAYRRSKSGAVSFASTFELPRVGRLVVPETSRFVYLVNENSLEVLFVETNSGTLHPVPDALYSDATWPVFDQVGQYILARRTDGTFVLYQSQSNGQLRLLRLYDFAPHVGGPGSVYGLIFDKTNRFLIVYSDTHVATFRFDVKSGEISTEPASVFPTRAGTPSQAITLIPE